VVGQLTIAFVVAATFQTLVTRRPATVSCGTRVHTTPAAFATSIAATRATSYSNSSGRSPQVLPYHRTASMPTLMRDARGPRSGSEDLTGVLEAAMLI
jgi:hypothetical protein